MIDLDGVKTISGYIFDDESNTIGNKRYKFIPNGYWVGAKGKHITSYYKADSDNGLEDDGYIRQYSMSRVNGHNVFFIETVDKGW